MQERVDPHIVREIELSLKREIELYKKYLEITREERSFVVKFKTDRVQELTQKREGLIQEMLIAQDKRLHMMRSFPHADGRRLSDLVKKYCIPRDAKRLIALIAELKKLVHHSKQSGSEFGHVVSFSINVLNGVLSIFWNATRNVVRSYSRKGKIQEKFNPTQDRSSTVLKQA